MFQIEKNVPLAPRSGATAMFPFADMEIGDSISVPKDNKASKNLSAKARSWATGKGFTERKFAQRTNGVSVRIWRVA